MARLFLLHLPPAKSSKSKPHNPSDAADLLRRLIGTFAVTTLCDQDSEDTIVLGGCSRGSVPRNPSEAILWHGGELAESRDAFLRMPKPEREALLTFLDSF